MIVFFLLSQVRTKQRVVLTHSPCPNTWVSTKKTKKTICVWLFVSPGTTFSQLDVGHASHFFDMDGDQKFGDDIDNKEIPLTFNDSTTSPLFSSGMSRFVFYCFFVVRLCCCE